MYIYRYKSALTATAVNKYRNIKYRNLPNKILLTALKLNYRTAKK